VKTPFKLQLGGVPKPSGRPVEIQVAPTFIKSTKEAPSESDYADYEEFSDQDLTESSFTEEESGESNSFEVDDDYEPSVRAQAAVVEPLGVRLRESTVRSGAVRDREPLRIGYQLETDVGGRGRDGDRSRPREVPRWQEDTDGNPFPSQRIVFDGRMLHQAASRFSSGPSREEFDAEINRLSSTRPDTSIWLERA
jgi:hypothetical protein